MTPMNVNGKRTRQNPSNLRPPRPKAVHSRPYNKPALKLLIIGCGRVGSQIAANMDKAGHEVVIIDRDPNAFSRASTRGVLTREFKGDQVVGNGTDVDVLRRAGIERADGFVAVTEGDNRNIMASRASTIPSEPRLMRSSDSIPSAPPSKDPSTSRRFCWSARASESVYVIVVGGGT